MLGALPADGACQGQQQRETGRIAREDFPVSPEVRLIVDVRRLAGWNAGHERRQWAGVVEDAAVAQVVGEGEKGELVAGQIPGGTPLEAAFGDQQRQQDEAERDPPTRHPEVSAETTEPPEGSSPPGGPVIVRD